MRQCPSQIEVADDPGKNDLLDVRPDLLDIPFVRRLRDVGEDISRLRLDHRWNASFRVGVVALLQVQLSKEKRFQSLARPLRFRAQLLVRFVEVREVGLELIPLKEWGRAGSERKEHVRDSAEVAGP